MWLTLNVQNDTTLYFGIKIALFPVFQCLIHCPCGFFIQQRSRFSVTCKTQKTKCLDSPVQLVHRTLNSLYFQFTDMGVPHSRLKGVVA